MCVTPSVLARDRFDHEPGKRGRDWLEQEAIDDSRGHQILEFAVLAAIAYGDNDQCRVVCAQRCCEAREFGRIKRLIGNENRTSAGGGELRCVFQMMGDAQGMIIHHRRSYRCAQFHVRGQDGHRYAGDFARLRPVLWSLDFGWPEITGFIRA